MQKALFWKKLKGKTVQCVLCPWFCVLADGGIGKCRNRKNVGGKLYSIVYGKVAALNVDPIEKKPFYHFAPGSRSLSWSTTGCNLACSFCQNFEISAAQKPFGEDLTPKQIVEMAKQYHVPGIAYTYTEPTVYIEFALDTMKLAKKAGLYNVWVSNGYINPGPAKIAAKYIDAINVDMKGDVPFYKKLCGVPNENPVKEALKVYKKAGVWIEITNLIIPGYNDKKAQVEKLVKWIKTNLGADTPLHFSRFYPQYKLANATVTPEKTLSAAYNVAKKAGMKWVYVGNIAGHKMESSYCWKDGTLLVERVGYESTIMHKKCPKCGSQIPLKGMEWIK